MEKWHEMHVQCHFTTNLLWSDNHFVVCCDLFLPLLPYNHSNHLCNEVYGLTSNRLLSVYSVYTTVELYTK